MKTKLAVSLAFVLAISAQAFAQKGGGGGGGFGGKGGGAFGERGGPNRIYWVNNIDTVTAEGSDQDARRRKMMGLDQVEKKYIFVYIRPIAETNDPNVFENATIVELSHNQWVFVKMDFDKDNVHQKAWGVKTAPMILGCDLHSNDFCRTSSLGIGDVRQVTGGLPEMIARYEQKLKADYAKAMDLSKSDEPKAMKLFVDIVAGGKKGYKEVDESATRLNDFAEASLRKAELPESVSPEAGIDYLDDLAKSLKGTPPGVQAEIRIARLDHERGNVQGAILRLLSIQKYDPKLKAEIEKAGGALDDISKAGEAKVELAASGDRALAKETLRKLAKDYAGTDAGKKALDASRKFE